MQFQPFPRIPPLTNDHRPMTTVCSIRHILGSSLCAALEADKKRDSANSHDDAPHLHKPLQLAARPVHDTAHGEPHEKAGAWAPKPD
jgi:hypothetical protein